MSKLQRQADDTHLCLEFPPLLELFDSIGQEVRRFLQEHGCGADLFSVELITREAVCNAVIHGSGLSPTRPVRYELELCEEGVCITVTDGGEGWDWQSQNCQLPAEDDESGRGLFIIKSYADSVEFNEKGNRIRVFKRFSGNEEEE